MSIFHEKMECPICRLPLKEMKTKEGFTIDICEECWGIWVDGDELVYVGGEFGLPQPIQQQPSGWSCPRCEGQMIEASFKTLTIDFCEQCGGIWLDNKQELLKLRQLTGVIPETAPTTSPRPPISEIKVSQVQEVEKPAWMSLGIGLVLAIFVFILPFLNYIFSYFLILTHELGHTITGWLFGYPSIPAFDFAYGGGVTLHQNRVIPLVILIYIGWGILFYLYRRNRESLFFLILCFISYSFLAFTDGHDIVNLFMGHGMELIFAGIFLYRAISRHAVIHSLERPLYAFLGFFIMFYDLRFAYQLVNSPYHRYLYGAAKGGGHWMDFSQIATYLHTNVRSVALFFLICCFLPPLISFLLYRYQVRFNQFILNLLDRQG